MAWGGTQSSQYSVPHLQEVAFIGMYICPLMYPEEDIHIDSHSLAPLTSFHYQITHSPWAVNIPTETDALAVVFADDLLSGILPSCWLPWLGCAVLRCL